MTSESISGDECRPGRRLIFRAWIRKKDGTKIWARQFGKRAFPIWIDDNGVEIAVE